MTKAEQIAALLPMAHTGGYREASGIVRSHVANAGVKLDPLMFENIVAAVMQRSREHLSQLSEQFRRAA